MPHASRPFPIISQTRNPQRRILHGGATDPGQVSARECSPIRTPTPSTPRRIHNKQRSHRHSTGSNIMGPGGTRLHTPANAGTGTTIRQLIQHQRMELSNQQPDTNSQLLPDLWICSTAHQLSTVHCPLHQRMPAPPLRHRQLHALLRLASEAQATRPKPRNLTPTREHTGLEYTKMTPTRTRTTTSRKWTQPTQLNRPTQASLRP